MYAEDNDGRSYDSFERAIEDGRIAVYAISMAITMQLNGIEYEGTAEWKHMADDGIEMDFNGKSVEWFEANCELLDIEWENEAVDTELSGIDLTQVQALCEEFNFDLDVVREN